MSTTKLRVSVNVCHLHKITLDPPASPLDSLSNGDSFMYGKYKDIFSRLHVAWKFTKSPNFYPPIITGIETTVVFWPVKLKENGRVLFFKFIFWDCGENSLRRFDHLLPVGLTLLHTAVLSFFVLCIWFVADILALHRLQFCFHVDVFLLFLWFLLVILTKYLFLSHVRSKQMQYCFYSPSRTMPPLKIYQTRYPEYLIPLIKLLNWSWAQSILSKVLAHTNCIDMAYRYLGYLI